MKGFTGQRKCSERTWTWRPISLTTHYLLRSSTTHRLLQSLVVGGPWYGVALGLFFALLTAALLSLRKRPAVPPGTPRLPAVLPAYDAAAAAARAAVMPPVPGAPRASVTSTGAPKAAPAVVAPTVATRSSAESVSASPAAAAGGGVQIEMTAQPSTAVADTPAARGARSVRFSGAHGDAASSARRRDSIGPDDDEEAVAGAVGVPVRRPPSAAVPDVGAVPAGVVLPVFPPAYLTWRKVTYTVPGKSGSRGKKSGDKAAPPTAAAPPADVTAPSPAETPSPSTPGGAAARPAGAPVPLLDSVSGLVAPGTITAVVTHGHGADAGRVAAGAKRALLSLLAARPVRGVLAPPSAIALNGAPLTPALARGHVAVSFNDDALNPHETVGEAVWVSARMRLDFATAFPAAAPSSEYDGAGASAPVAPPSSASLAAARSPASLLSGWVSHVLSLCELAHVAGMSTDALAAADPAAHARLRIAVELAANPSALLVEDPLAAPAVAHSAAGYRSVLRVLRQVAASGRSVLVTLHAAAPDALSASRPDRVIMVASPSPFTGARVIFNGSPLRLRAKLARVNTVGATAAAEAAAARLGRASTADGEDAAIGAAADDGGAPRHGHAHNASDAVTDALAQAFAAMSAIAAGDLAGVSDAVSGARVGEPGSQVGRIVDAERAAPGLARAYDGGAADAAEFGEDDEVDAVPRSAESVGYYGSGGSGGGMARAGVPSLRPSATLSIALPRELPPVPPSRAAAYTTPLWWQFAYVAYRQLRYGWRNLQLNRGRNVTFVILGVYFGLLFYGLDVSDFKGVSSQASIVFFLCTSGAILVFSSLASDGLAKARPVYYRERAAGYYLPEAFTVMQVRAHRRKRVADRLCDWVMA